MNTAIAYNDFYDRIADICKLKPWADFPTLDAGWTVYHKKSRPTDTTKLIIEN